LFDECGLFGRDVYAIRTGVEEECEEVLSIIDVFCRDVVRVVFPFVFERYGGDVAECDLAQGLFTVLPVLEDAFSGILALGVEGRDGELGMPRALDGGEIGERRDFSEEVGRSRLCASDGAERDKRMLRASVSL
jgi:hypothetical protein